MVALMLYRYLPPTTKLGQGNIFRSVCKEFCPWGGGGIPACLAGLQAHTQGEVKGSGLGGLEAHTQGGLQAHTWGGIPACTEADPPPSCGRYASYWNAFLFVDKSKQLKNYFKSIAEHKDVTKLVMMLSSTGMHSYS